MGGLEVSTGISQKVSQKVSQKDDIYGYLPIVPINGATVVSICVWEGGGRTETEIEAEIEAEVEAESRINSVCKHWASRSRFYRFLGCRRQRKVAAQSANVSRDHFLRGWLWSRGSHIYFVVGRVWLFTSRSRKRPATIKMSELGQVVLDCTWTWLGAAWLGRVCDYVGRLSSGNDESYHFYEPLTDANPSYPTETRFTVQVINGFIKFIKFLDSCAHSTKANIESLVG